MNTIDYAFIISTFLFLVSILTYKQRLKDYKDSFRYETRGISPETDNNDSHPLYLTLVLMLIMTITFLIKLFSN